MYIYPHLCTPVPHARISLIKPFSNKRPCPDILHLNHHQSSVAEQTTVEPVCGGDVREINNKKIFAWKWNFFPKENRFTPPAWLYKLMLFIAGPNEKSFRKINSLSPSTCIFWYLELASLSGQEPWLNQVMQCPVLGIQIVECDMKSDCGQEKPP